MLCVLGLRLVQQDLDAARCHDDLNCQASHSDCAVQELHGVFRAVSAGSWNLDPLAYGGKQKEGSMYPAQVRVEYCPRCPPMEEQYFKPAIADNYFNPNRFRWELNERQVFLCLSCLLGKLAILTVTALLAFDHCCKAVAYRNA